jgi:hypothetical protein
MDLSSTPITRTAATPHQRLLFTHKPWIYNNFSSSQLFTITTTSKSVIKSTIHPSTLSSILKPTVPMPTPWYSPAGPFDWWQWQWYTTKIRKASKKLHSTRRTSTTRTKLAATTTTTTTTVRLTNKTSAIPTTTKSQATLGSFKWSDQTTVSPKKESSDEFEDEYKDWIEYFTADPIRDLIKSTSTSASIPSREQYQQMGYPPTKSNWKIITINTPPSKRQDPQQNSVVSERNAITTSTNGENEFIFKKKDLLD